jgi:RimJ/RimL family protein N-acetyltransferase
MSELRTARLLLRRWQEQDRAPFAALNSDPVVLEHFPSTMTGGESDALVDRIEAHFEEHGYGLWAVEVDGVFVGFTGLVWQTYEAPFTPALEVGWRLARSAWGHGFATEAATAALGRGLEVVDSVVSTTALTNLRSQRVMQRLGMRRELEFDHPRVPQDHPVRPHVLYRTP